MKKLTGRCLCEKIVYEIQGDLGPVYHCHCSKCRRWHGAAFRTRTSINKKQFKWICGKKYLSHYNSSNFVVKSFCSLCGSNLISTYTDKPDIIGLPLGGLEQDPEILPKAHIFVGSKAPWYQIIDGITQFEEWPESEDNVRKTNP